MNSSDRSEFDEQMALLCAGYNVPVSVRPDAYWKGMAKMSILEFARCVEYALSEDGPDKIPNTKDLWNIRRQLRRTATAPPPRAAEPEAEIPMGLQLVNGRFLKYLELRRLKQGFRGDLNVAGRRAACIELGKWVQGLIDEGMKPELGELQQAFDAAMAKIPDGVPVGEDAEIF
jgi:hypothetical protein